MGEFMADETLMVQPTRGLRGRVTVPGDKSISHRAVMFGALANGDMHIRGWLAAGDTEASLRCVQALGVAVERHSEHDLTIHGTGRLQAAAGSLDFVNAGTGIRLMAGIMAGQPFGSVLDGSAQLRRRPMRRIIAPLRLMGAQIDGADDRAPLTIHPAQLHGIHYALPMASAQVKSAVVLAGLFAEGETTVVQPGPARDHTERMLQAMGAPVILECDTVRVTRSGALQPVDLNVPGDFSSAAFLLAAGCIVPDSEVTLTGINLNPTRTGLLDVLLRMGADIEVTETGLEAGEPAGEILVRYSALKGVEVGGDDVVRMIDEFPALMVAALHAEGRTVVRDAQELRVKETDRLAVMTGELRKLGAEITETEDGFVIDGPQPLTGGIVDGHDDHRVAMSLAVAGLTAQGQTTVLDAKCIGDSFPGFAEALTQLGGQLRPAAV
jgi:3-phosphoshikimate 1-carboxyvinyltransferase